MNTTRKNTNNALLFWHPFGPHQLETRDEIIKRKHQEIALNGWTLWSFRYRNLEPWLEHLDGNQGSEFHVYCSDSAAAKDPVLSKSGQTITFCRWYRRLRGSWEAIPKTIKVTQGLNKDRLGAAFKVSKIELIDRISCRLFLHGYQWFRMKDKTWRSDPLPTRGEYLLRDSGNVEIRSVHAVLTLCEPHLVEVTNIQF